MEHRSRPMESLLDPSSGLRFAVACHTEAYFTPSSFLRSLVFKATGHSLFMTFKVIMSHFQFGVQSHFFNFGVQSHHRFSVLAFRAIVSFSLGVQSRSSPSFGIQSHFSSFGVQSHHHFSVSAFRAIVSFSFGVQSRSSPSFGIQSHFSSFGVQSHYPFPEIGRASCRERV